MYKYLVTLESGRDFIIDAYDDIDAMFAADNEAKLFDDYLVDVKPIELDTFHMDKAFETARKEV